MSNWINFPCLHQTGKQLDGQVYVNPQNISIVLSANESDKKQRPEINAVVITSGGAYATSDSPATLMLKIKQADAAIPNE